MYIKKNQIFDNEGRSLILRGCNLGGSTKAPSLETNDKISFTGKPFPLPDAEERFAEMKKWGLRFNRLVIPWEALEHDGPGIYDEEYLAYLRKILLVAEKFGISIWIDPHQDVWGRAAGGDGAPAWTLEALGIDVKKLEAAGAILPKKEIDPPSKRPSMIWPTGYSRYAAATMFTLFFAGNVYAPGVKPDEKISGGDSESSIQNWLQNKYIDAYAHCKRRLKSCSAIVGWGTMNEPHPGFIGYKNLNDLENYLVASGPMPSAFSAMAAASGYKTEVPIYTTGLMGVRKKGKVVLNPSEVSIFKEGFSCPWKASGVWADGAKEPKLFKPDHFAKVNGKPVNFYNDFLSPFMDKYIKRLGENDEKTFFFIEGIPGNFAIKNSPLENTVSSAGSGRTINGFHWYDGITMYLKQWRPWFNYDLVANKVVLGRKAVAKLFKKRLKDQFKPGMPNILGEFGLPFDIFKGSAYTSGDYSKHEEALSFYYDALDELGIGCCIWCYSADNTFRLGDSWNNEDFSIVTKGNIEEKSKYSLRPRAAGGWLRPYPLAVAGTPLVFKWDRKTKKLFFRYKSDPKINAPTMIFIPEVISDKAFIVSCGAGSAQNAAKLPAQEHNITTEYKPEENVLLVYHNGFDGEIVVE